MRAAEEFEPRITVDQDEENGPRATSSRAALYLVSKHILLSIRASAR